jgi:RNA polymerase sigma factor (sigma-70 family)
MTAKYLDLDLGIARAYDSTGMFLIEIGRVPLLTAEQEIELGQQAWFLSKVQEFQKEGSRSHEETLAHFSMTESEFQAAVRRANRAKEKMIAANMRLVVSIAKKYLGRGISLQDLISEGALGLNRGCEKFDPTKGYKFSTYAYWWIRQAVTRAIANDSRIIRLPIHITEKLNKVRKRARLMHLEMKRRPTNRELAEDLGMTEADLEQLYSFWLKPMSLNYMAGHRQDTELGDLLASDVVSPVEAVEQSTGMARLRKILEDALEPREAEVISMRFGLTDGQTYTLAEVGRHYNLSRERIRQIQTKAMRILRRPYNLEALKVCAEMLDVS